MRVIACVLLAFVAATSAAQQRPVFDVDDFVDPRLHPGPVFVSRLIGGAALDLIDDYRPLHEDGAFLSLANSLYWSRFQFDYKHSEVRAEPPPVFACGCGGGIVFPTPPLPDETPNAPRAGSRDVLQFGWYYRVPRTERMLRLRLTASRQAIPTSIHSPSTGAVLSRLSGKEKSIGLEGDAYVRIRGHALFGTLVWAHTSREGTADDREQSELTYTTRFPAISVHKLLLRTTLTIGGVSDRGGTLLNAVSPWFEAIWHETHSGINVHLVWNPQAMNDGANGWRTTHQIALFADRALFVKHFR